MMAGLWSMIIPEPEELTNLVENPSLETDTNGYTAVSASLSRVTTLPRRGLYVLQVSPTGSTDGEGVYYGDISLTNGVTYRFSLDFRGVNGTAYAINFSDTDGSSEASQAITGSGSWERISVKLTASGTANRRLYILTGETTSGIFYVDGLMCVQETSFDESYMNGGIHTYFDGDSLGARWQAAEHASLSIKSPHSRASGREINLDTFQLYLSDFEGIGTPELDHRVIQHALVDGASYHGAKIQPRYLLLTGQVVGDNLADLHLQRRYLIDAVKSDRITQTEPIIFRYSGANGSKDIEIAAYYERGLTFQGPDGFSERMALRFLATDPFFYEDGNDASNITSVNRSVSNANYILRRDWRDGVNSPWEALASGTNGDVKTMALAEDGTLYIGGSFTAIGGDTDFQYVAKWDPVTEAWSTLGAGMDDEVLALAIDPAGNVYAGGAFTNADGGGANRIAVWDGANWSALGSGLNNTVNALLFGSDGLLYVGGVFTTAGGSGANDIATWDGSSWSALGAGTGSQVLTIVQFPNGDIFAGGVDAKIWDGSSWTTLDTAVNIFGAAIAPNGDLYVTGQFTSIGGVSAARIAKWNGNVFSPLGTGLNDDGYSIAIDKNGVLWVNGKFTTAGGLTTTNRLALWNGFTWAHIDATLPGSPTVYRVILDEYQDRVYVGFSTSGTATGSAKKTIEISSTRRTFPVIKIECTATGGTLKWIKNETTGATLYFDYDIQVGERLIIDTRPLSRKIVSNKFGNVIGRSILRGSGFNQFFLMPKTPVENLITVFIDAGTYNFHIEWRNTHWSVDGVAS